jgi:hypothetical protein
VFPRAIVCECRRGVLRLLGWVVGTQGRGSNCFPGVEWRSQRGRSPPERVILSISTLATLFLCHPSNTYNNILHTNTSPLRLSNPTHTSC